MIDSKYNVPGDTVSTLTDVFNLFPFTSIGNSLSMLCYRLMTHPPLVSRSGKPIELLPSGPISLIGNNSPSLAAIMHRGVRLKKVTTKRTKVSPSVAASTLAQAFKVNFQIILPIPIPFLHLLHLYSQIFIVVSAHRYISKDQKYNCRCPSV